MCNLFCLTICPKGKYSADSPHHKALIKYDIYNLLFKIGQV